jgi:lysophospholipase L1-like esterase
LLFCSATEEKKVRILCVGDSITQGGKKSQLEYTYRLPLQILLREKKIAYDFIGSRQQGLDGGVNWPDVAKDTPFDPDHEGYYGYKTRPVCNKVKEAFAGYNVVPDIVLVHLGTNDQKAGDYEKNIGEPLTDFIKFLRTKNQEVLVLLGHLNFNHGEVAHEIRDVVENVAKKMNSKKSPVVTVHHYKGWRENPEDIYTDTYDWAHPNLKGQEKMAVHWLNTMEPYLSSEKN